MRILITGLSGFAGGHLAEALLGRGGAELFGVSRRAELPEGCRHLGEQVRLLQADLADGAALEALLREVRPDRLYHLAGYAQTGQSFKEVEAAWAGNLTATLSLYEAVGRWGGRPRVLHVSSGLVYGDAEPPPEGFDESAPLQPASPYAASKAAADLAAYQYTRFPGLEIVRVRPFNHVGPRQARGFALADFAAQVAAAEQGRRPPVLETGDLRPHRDFTDVRDMVEAYVLLMEKGRPGEAYNACTGVTLSMQQVLDDLLALSPTRVEVRPDAKRPRASAAALRGNAAKLRRETGWSPRYTLQQTLADTLAYWRSAVPRP